MLKRFSLLGLALLLLLSPSALPQADDEPDYAALRGRMVDLVEIQIALTAQETGVEALDPKIAEAMRALPRHAFVPDLLQPYAYGDSPLPVGHDQNIASPFLIALMTQVARVEPGDVVYETGTGAGYHAALLSQLAARVYSVEVVEPLAKEVAAKLNKLGFEEVQARQGDGYYGWPEQGPFDVMIIKESVDHVPKPLLDQLRPGGRMVIPLGPAGQAQMLTLVEKRDDGRVRRTSVLPVIFSPLQGGERT